MVKADRIFVAWEEHTVCAEKGNRVVHYYVKNVLEESVLAVVGTERSVRPMTYVVADQFVQSYKGCVSLSRRLKWRARRDVMEWLESLVSYHVGTFTISNMERDASGSLALPGSGSFIHQPSYQMSQRKVKCQSRKLNWYGTAYFCGKQLKHYQALRTTEATLAVHSFVFIMAEEESNYLGYIEDMYEDKKGHKKVKVRWFHYGEELKTVISGLDPKSREVFITNHVQVISAESIDCPAIVLTPNHYDKFLEVVSEPSTLGVYMCFRQFSNNSIKSFNPTKLRGYANQAILPCLDDPIFDRDEVKLSKLNITDKENLTSVNMDEAGIKRKRKITGERNQEPEREIGKNSATFGRVTDGKQAHSSLKSKLSGETVNIKLKVPQSPCLTTFRVDDKIELLSLDSGIRGCWFSCKILRVCHKKLKVQYDDLEDAEGTGNLEEWVSAEGVAAPDKLGMRCDGRPTIRPCPPDNSGDSSFDIGAPVDALWCDGRWEGVVIQHGKAGTDTRQIYLPGENMFLVLERKYIRSSRDWMGNRWVAVKEKPDIMDFVNSNIFSNVKPHGCFTLIRVPGRDGLALPKFEPCTASKLDTFEENENVGSPEIERTTNSDRSCQLEHEVTQSGEVAPLTAEESVLVED